ncbi:heterokaryon incompatibility protein-domain-containing protein [Xylariales sp. PMI_506]|nr:heterokaryon incompatibility protein-domain-containing protein [Xylariales sp. PMI_506]
MSFLLARPVEVLVSITDIFSSMAKPYRYSFLSPAASTRILEIQPCYEQDGALRCHLRELNIESDPFFEALSYTWGKPEFTEQLIIDEEFEIKITPNLRDALLRFRSRLDVRRLWVDAVCINQQDDQDKAKQIPLMTQIYRRCSGVLVWLGNDSDGLLSMDSINAHSRRIGYEDDDEDIQREIESLVRLPWFGRRWIVQEVVLNQNVTLFCSGSEIPWLRLLQVVRRSQDTGGLLSVLKTMESLWVYHCLGMGSSSQAPLSMLELLSALSELECMDARDRIYALAALASDGLLIRPGETGLDPREIKVVVDYTQPVENLYIDVIVENFRCFDYQDILKHTDIRADGDRLSGLCSWVPDWRLPVVRRQLSGGWRLEGSPTISLDAASRTLHARFAENRKDPGYMICGRVEKTSSAFPLHASEEDIKSWILEVLSLLVGGVIPRGGAPVSVPPSASLVHQLGMILFQDHMKAEWSKNITSLSWQMYYFKGYEPFTKMVLENVDYPQDEELLTMLRHTMEGRCLFLLSPATERSCQGHDDFSSTSVATYEKCPAIGIGPSHTHPGDLVCTRGIATQRWAEFSYDCTADSTFLVREPDDDDGLATGQDGRFFYVGEARANQPDRGSARFGKTARTIHSIAFC